MESDVTGVPSHREQLRLIESLLQQNIEEGQTWYVIEGRWFAAWEAHVKSGGPKPAAIDNSQLVDSSDDQNSKDNATFTRLKPGLTAPQSVQVVPQDAWDLLCSWYGFEGAAIPRKAVNYDLSSNTEVRIELYPATFLCFIASELRNAKSSSIASRLSVPAYSTIQQLIDLIKTAIKLSDKETRIYIISVDNISEFNRKITPDFSFDNSILLDDEEKNKRLVEAELGQNCYAIVDLKDSKGDWGINSKDQSLPLTASQHSVASPQKSLLSKLHAERQERSAAPMSRVRSSPQQGSRPRGITGLSNLGNTCFMNSALQCLSNTAELTRYFISGVWKSEINRTNPLGMHGAVAESYGNLVEKLWSGTANSFAPREFKQTIGRFAPSFSGYSQQDSQEFLAFLLDGLHEDLNRIVKKPYTETPDIDTLDHPEQLRLGGECWNLYKKRNDSVIVDLFQGQYKSTLVCPVCQKVSITFDPFMYLTLPIPVSTQWKHKIHVIPYDETKRPMIIQVMIRKDASLKALKAKIADISALDVNRLVAVEIFSGRVYKVFRDDEQVSEIRPEDIIYIHELRWPVPAISKRGAKLDEDRLVVLLQNRKFYNNSYHRSRGYTLGYPLPLCLTKTEASSITDIYNSVTRLVQRYTKLDLSKPCSNSGQAIEEPNNDSERADPMSMDGDEPAMDVDQSSSTPNSPLFTLKVTSASLNRLQPGILSTDSASDANHNLSKRIPKSVSSRRKSSEKMDVSLDNEWSQNEDPILQDPIDATPAEIDEDDENEVANATTPLLRMGELLVLSWNEAGYRAAFGEDEDDNESNSLWKEFDIIEDPDVQSNAGKAKRALSLDDCLQEFTKEEKLGEEDLWYCPRCKAHQQASKKFDLWKLPDILVVHLKRFSSSRLYRDKITALVDFPLEGLDLRKYLQGVSETDSESFIYDLYAVDNHMGMLGGGHYTSFGYNFEQGKWYLFDDSSVREVTDLSNLISANAYLLFFRRRSAQPLGGISHQKTLDAETIGSLRRTPSRRSDMAVADGGAGIDMSTADESSPSSLHSLQFNCNVPFVDGIITPEIDDDDDGLTCNISPIHAEPGSSTEDGVLLTSDDEPDKDSEFDGYFRNNYTNASSVSDVDTEDSEGIGRQMLKRRTRSPDTTEVGLLRQSPKRDIFHTSPNAAVPLSGVKAKMKTTNESVGFNFGQHQETLDLEMVPTPLENEEP